MTDRGAEADDDRGDASSEPLACTRCGTALEPGGIVELRTGGHGAAAHLFLGNLADLSESKLPVELQVCPACGHVELFRAW
jgi:hypothetical protein